MFKENTAFLLAEAIALQASELQKNGFGEQVARISPGIDRERFLQFGSTRKGYPIKALDVGTALIPLSYQTLQHDEVIIASTIPSILLDAEHPGGTLEHKLRIYQDPFVCFYRKEALELIVQESPLDGCTNQGAHWKLPEDPFKALTAAFSVSKDLALLTNFLKMPNPDPQSILPPVRHYFALTNFCNRSCELCSCHSDPKRTTHMTYDTFLRIVSSGRPYEAQLEGGEPTIHPDFWKMVQYLTKDPLCTKIILCTNSVTVPVNKNINSSSVNLHRVQQWLLPFIGKPLLLKPSFNQHLFLRDGVLIQKLSAFREAMQSMPFLSGSGYAINFRRLPIPLSVDRDESLAQHLKDAGLWDCTQDFEFQRYGRGTGELSLALPFVIENPVEFYLHSPDGLNFGTDLIARANHMEFMD